MSIEIFKKKKSTKEKIHMLTCYDYWSAKILNSTNLDAILVGDSTAMIMHGHQSTLTANMQMMCFHTQAVANGAKNKFIVADMPFGSFRLTKEKATECAVQLMQSGAHSVKVEGVRGNEEIIQHLVESGIPVMGHLGLTPQSVNQLGGYKVQGRTETAADLIVKDANKLAELGCFALVLECVPNSLAKKITDEISIATIGIGAGPDCDGQILVLQDMLGAQSELQPKFVRKYAELEKTISNAIDSYCSDVESKKFPSIEESYQ